MSAYTEFVKANYHKVKHLPQKQRFAELGKMWKKSKGGVLSGAGMDEHGAGFLSQALGAFGLGLDTKKGRKPRGRGVSGAGISGAGISGAGISGAGVSGAGMDEHGAGFLSDALGAFGLGLKTKKGRKPRGKGISGAGVSGAGMDEHGAGFLSQALGAIGLGLDQKKLH